jgi:predicted acetyltransferase
MKLVLPSSEYKDSFIEAVKEYQADTEHPLSYREDSYRTFVISELEDDFDAYVQKRLSQSSGENLPPGYVPQTDYWLVDNEEFIGRVSIRHELSERLQRIGGHIGYDIRPSKRKRGYGSAILKLGLEKAKELGIEKVLLTCDEGNVGSRKIIEKNGGVLENKVTNPETGIDKLRFWIAS